MNLHIHKLILLIFVNLLNNSIDFVISNEVLGCGGFIKSHANIDFSKIEVKLYTKQGSLKDKTDCSPSNGYYFIPIYDKGEYILKIVPPPGWSFEPELVELNFNGKNDICSRGDVNFIFKGFGITGKVFLIGQQNVGVKDVNVILNSDDGKELRKTVTDINGVFSFTPIAPGNYLIKASHDKWYFSKSEYQIKVENGNTELPVNTLVVAGFDVEGRFGSNGQELKSIAIVLFKEQNQKLKSYCTMKEDINTKMPSILLEKSSYDKKPICVTKLDKNGNYLFNGIAPGKYLILPIQQSKEVKLNFVPEFLEFNVEKDAVVLKETIEIVGYSVNGMIYSSSDGRGVPDAIVKLNNQEVTKTNKNGLYILENVKTGNYKMQIISDLYKFDEQSIEISPVKPMLPNIFATGYKVCGKVVSEKSHNIGITKEDNTFHIEISSDASTREWCTYLSPGKYFVQVLTTNIDKANGLQFFPLKQTIKVHESPMSGIIFSQLKVTLTGEVKCLPDSLSNCKNVEVTLQGIDSTGKLNGEAYVTTVIDGKYKFENILPGPYEISIPQSNLCWESTKSFLNIMSATETAPPFIHKGYEVSIISSHRTKMQYILRSESKQKSELMELMSGVNTFCVESSGDYDIELIGCHKFDTNTPKSFSTNDKNPIVIQAIAHKIGVRILSTESDIDTFKMLIETKSTKEMMQLQKENQTVDGYYSYYYSMYLKPDEIIMLRPQSNIMLFKPEFKEITGGNDCIDVAFSFIAVKGLLINGKIVPPIKDVKITLSFPKNPDLKSLQTTSLTNGEFKFGPIDGNLEIELKAEKESYTFSEFDRKTNTFNAHKLCDVVVTVKDESGNKLSGVLLSLSGAESYRKNLITGNDGTIKFHSLSPSQYFLRPMMKEYKFNPNSKLIDVKNGETVQVELSGKRVAFSAFGTITSLNGDVFPNVIIEAISDERCSYHQEESISENNGQYRIRGLQPDCSYTIRMKNDGNSNSNVERTIPLFRKIQVKDNDIRNINLIAISPVNIVDVSARVYASSIDHYKTLKIQLYRKSNSDSPIYSQRIDVPHKNHLSRFNPGVMVFFPRIPLDGKLYFIELKTSMSDKIYKYHLPAIQFIANTSSIFVELEFNPEIKSNDMDINQNSISALILIGLVVIAFFRQDLAIEFFNFIWNRINSIIQDIITHNENKKKFTRYNQETINYKEIEQLAEGINSIKKKKTKKI